MASIMYRVSTPVEHYGTGLGIIVIGGLLVWLFIRNT